MNLLNKEESYEHHRKTADRQSKGGRIAVSKICFIVGHGKGKSGVYDPGATSNGYHEYRIAKEIAEYAQTYYNANFVKQADIMNENTDLYLTERIKKVNQMGYDFVVEIHLNAGCGTGTECYYNNGNSVEKNDDVM